MEGLDDVDGRPRDQVFEEGQPAIHVDGHELALRVERFRLLLVLRHAVLLEEPRADEGSVDVVATERDGGRRPAAISYRARDSGTPHDQLPDEVGVIGQVVEEGAAPAPHPVDQQHVEGRVRQAVEHHPFAAQPVHRLLHREVVGQVLRVLHDVLTTR
jgi:hypothetical protein